MGQHHLKSLTSMTRDLQLKNDKKHVAGIVQSHHSNMGEYGTTVAAKQSHGCH